MKKVGSRIVGIGDRARAKLRGESKGVDKGDNIGELLDEDMLSQIRVTDEELEIKTSRSMVGYCKLGLSGAAQGIGPA
jgi:hypothetical protein